MCFEKHITMNCWLIWQSCQRAYAIMNCPLWVSLVSGGSRISHSGSVDLVVGAVDPRGGYILKILHVKTKESGPVGGACARHAPPRSANACCQSIACLHYPVSLSVDKLCSLITETSYFAHICTYAPSICT